MTHTFRAPGCACHALDRAASIKASMRAALDARNYSTDGVAYEMGMHPATLRRYLSDTYPGTLPVDQLHGWWRSTGGDLSPVRTQLHLCGIELQVIQSCDPPLLDSPGQIADLSRRSGELVARMIEQLADGQRTPEERREALPMLVDLRAALDRLIATDEAVLAGRR